MRRTVLMLLGMGTILIAAIAAPAQQDLPCKDDRQKFCRDIGAGAGRIRSCLRQHQSDLSETCKRHLSSLPSGNACSGDIQKYCAAVEAGGGRIRECLTQHRDELSQDCKEQVRRLIKRFGGCADDVEKFCKERDDKRACLKEHTSELSESCQQMQSRVRSRLRLQ